MVVTYWRCKRKFARVLTGLTPLMSGREEENHTFLCKSDHVEISEKITLAKKEICKTDFFDKNALLVFLKKILGVSDK